MQISWLYNIWVTTWNTWLPHFLNFYHYQFSVFIFYSLQFSAEIHKQSGMEIVESKKPLQSRSDVKLTFVKRLSLYFLYLLENDTDWQRRIFKVTLLIRYRFGFNLTDIGFTLREMSLKHLFNSHIPEIYSKNTISFSFLYQQPFSFSLLILFNKHLNFS